MDGWIDELFTPGGARPKGKVGVKVGIRRGDRTTKARFPAAITTTTPTNSF
jgi:hypothetical protein